MVAIQTPKGEVYEHPFDPNSTRLVKVDSGGKEEEITIKEWLRRLGTTGRGGT
jgi:hypothetical protein